MGVIWFIYKIKYNISFKTLLINLLSSSLLNKTTFKSDPDKDYIILDSYIFAH